jgi:hypothetical protein
MVARHQGRICRPLELCRNIVRLGRRLKLLDTTEKVLDGIAEHPMMFPASQKSPSIRKAVITKQTSLLYRIAANEIQLLHFWDNRRNPDLLEF